MGDERQEAVKRLNAKREFKMHATIYVGVNLLLVAIWALTNSDGYFWPIWPFLGWGIGLAAHWWSVFAQRPISEADIQREIDRDETRARSLPSARLARSLALTICNLSSSQLARSSTSRSATQRPRTPSSTDRYEPSVTS